MSGTHLVFYSFRNVRKEVENVKSEYVPREVYDLILYHLTPSNALAMRVCLETGMRVGDVVALRAENLRARNGNYEITYIAQKTGKCANVEISKSLYTALTGNLVDGSLWVFPSHSKTGHRTRQAVWHDVRRTARRLAIPMHLTPHSARKTYAVELTAKKGIEATKEALQHDRISTTAMYYAYSNRGLYGSDAPLDDASLDKIATKVADILARKLGLSDATRADVG